MSALKMSATMDKQNKSPDKEPLSRRALRRKEWWKKYSEKNKDVLETEQKAEAPGLGEDGHDNISSMPDFPGNHGNTSSAEDTPSSPAAAQRKKMPPKKKKYYVLFVGNLPYDVTQQELKEHFKRTGEIKDIRLLTNKDTGKSRGCAYIEFMDSKSHKFALRLHHSLLGGRKINVEFTSAGRKTASRQQKLENKNKAAGRFKMCHELWNAPSRRKKKP